MRVTITRRTVELKVHTNLAGFSPVINTEGEHVTFHWDGGYAEAIWLAGRLHVFHHGRDGQIPIYGRDELASMLQQAEAMGAEGSMIVLHDIPDPEWDT